MLKKYVTNLNQDLTPLQQGVSGQSQAEEEEFDAREDMLSMPVEPSEQPEPEEEFNPRDYMLQHVD